jgi:hypothetical protein
MKRGRFIGVLVIILFMAALVKPAQANDNTLKYVGAVLALGSAGWAITSGEGDNSLEFFEWKVLAAAGGVAAGWFMMMLSGKDTQMESSAENVIAKKGLMVGPLIVPRSGIYGVSVGFTF